MDQSLEPLTAALLDAARKAGADDADAIAVAGTSLDVDVRGGALEHAERSEAIDLGLRVILGQRQATVAASDTRPETLEEMATRAVAMAKEAPEDPGVGLAPAEQLSECRDAAGLELDDPGDDPDPAALERDALETEAAALAHDGISMMDSVGAGYARRRLHLAATNGFSGGYTRSDYSLYAVAITGEGTKMERDYYGESRTHRADMPSPAEVGRIAAERTLARAGARRPKTGAYPVLYDERISSGLIGHLLSAINGTAIVRGASWLSDAMGKQVLPAGLTLTEEPHRPRTGGARLFDAEGLPTRKRELVSDGILQSWILDLASARKLGLESTASASRSPAGAPAPSAGNVTLSQGTKSREELMRDMGTGFLVTSLLGSTINPNNGDYSRGASGFWIENGEIAYPVNECTIAGNLRDMLLGLTPANDARPWLSRVVPSLLVEGMTLAGE
ncbi:TldD/PmbA family protein [Tropicimonas sp. IMCC34011]|uniref:TldD/PmbA family protein n=1 Tax=Tropicimonas sp. IMCC34011 TaxID=2248759 RepID=UPI000E269097|nr:TldD/PmbA family protein [Tropicimonas sp. IMCC34011]